MPKWVGLERSWKVKAASDLKWVERVLEGKRAEGDPIGWVGKVLADESVCHFSPSFHTASLVLQPPEEAGRPAARRPATRWGKHSHL